MSARSGPHLAAPVEGPFGEQGKSPSCCRRPAWRQLRGGCAATFFIALAVRALTAAFIHSPGYMDAYYSFHVGARLAAGAGLTESVAWNYLTPPESLPRPAGAYWPPGTALLTAAGLSLVPRPHLRQTLLWRAAQLPPVLLSAAVAAGAYAAVRRLAPGLGAGRRAAAVAGLVVLSGVYFPYWVTTDSFTPFALVGGAVLWLSAEAAGRGTARAGALAAQAAFLIGIAQFVRPDAALLLVGPLLALAGRQRDAASDKGARHAMLVGLVAIISAFAAGLAVWLARNWLTWHAPTPPGTSAAIWLRTYDDLFAYAALPTFERWRAEGLRALLTTRGGALAGNLGVLGQPLLYYLAPFALYGAWRRRRRREFWPAMAYLVALYLVMSLAFPLQGVRGGLFHSMAAALPFLALWTVEGVEAAVAAAARRRRWLEPQAQRIFVGALLTFSAMSSAYFLALQAGRWDARLETYRRVAHLLDGYAPPPSRVLAVDPPGFWYASGREAIVIPSDGFESLRAAARQFDAGFLVVEASGPAYLSPLWLGTTPLDGFTCLGMTDRVALYAVDPSRSRISTVCPPVSDRP